MIKINLVPRELLDREVQRQRILQSSVAGAVVLFILLTVSALHFLRAKSLEGELAGLNSEYDKLAKVVAKVEELERSANAVRTRLAAITGLQKGRPLYPYFMTDFAKTLPGGVWVKSLNTTSKDNNSLTVTTSASSLQAEAISKWLRGLEQSGRFTDPILSGITVSLGTLGKEHTFSVTMTYKHPEL